MLGKIEKSVVTESVDKSVAKPNNRPRASTDGPMRAVHTDMTKVRPSIWCIQF